MSDPKKKKFKISDIGKWLRKGKDVADVGKILIPGKVDDVLIDKAKGPIEIAEDGLSLFEKIKGIFKKK